MSLRVKSLEIFRRNELYKTFNDKSYYLGYNFINRINSLGHSSLKEDTQERR